MNDNFLQQDPLALFDDFNQIPEDVFKNEQDKAELYSLVATVTESEDYTRILTDMFYNNRAEFEDNYSKITGFIEKADQNKIAEPAKAESIHYFMDKTIGILDEIKAYGGVFKKVPVKVYRLDEEVKLPVYMNGGDAGADIYANESLMVAPHTTCLVGTGLFVAIPGGYEIQIRPRSGLSLKTGIRIPNAPGTIDSMYRNEIKVIVENTSDESFTIEKGDRIAQMLIKQVPHIVWEEVDQETFNSYSSDRGAGFGSSGVNG